MALSFFLTGWADKDHSAEQLFARFCDTGNTSYLQKLISMHGTDLYHYLARQSDRVLAEDVSQQCWLKLLEHPYSFRGNSSFKTWLFSVGRNCLIDELRRLKRWQYATDSDELATDSCLVQQITDTQQQLQLGKQLQLLPFLQREALMLQLEGFSLVQIAHITQQNEETIKSRIRYARGFLQQLAGVSDDHA